VRRLEASSAATMSSGGASSSCGKCGERERGRDQKREIQRGRGGGREGGRGEGREEGGNIEQGLVVEEGNIGQGLVVIFVSDYDGRKCEVPPILGVSFGA